MFFVKNNNMNKFYKNKTIFLILLVFFILVILSIFIYFYILKQKEQKLYSFSEKLDEKYQTLSLYSTNNTVTNSNSTSNSSHIIGKITIDKIGLDYSILSSCSEDLLKISPCRLCGPEPNQIGNLCIAGHNYDNGKFFSNISKLSIGDIICIYDLNNNCLNYSIYDKFEVETTDTSVLNQDTNNKKELTLITCNNKKKNRFILKAKEMD